MTTLVYDGETLATDGKVTQGNTVVSLAYNKIYVFEKELYYRGDKLLVMAHCGATAERDKMVDHMYSEEFPSNDFAHESGFIIIGVKNIYTLESGTSYLITYPKNHKLVGGSGGDFALAAMAAGCNAVEAVKIACKLDVCSGGRIRTWVGGGSKKRKAPSDEESSVVIGDDLGENS